MSESKVILVSGGSRGLGQAIVEDLLNRGHQVATFSRSESPFIKEKKAADPEESHFFWRQADATDYKALKKFVHELHKKYGRIDGLINNAGANLDQLLTMTNDEQMHFMLTMNLESVLQLTRQVAKCMLLKSQGSIVTMSSILGHRGFKGTVVYSSTKAALDGMTRSLARELGGRGIRVNAVSPGFIETDMTRDMPEGQRNQIIRRTPMGRLGHVGDITGLVRFLIEDGSEFITGQSIIADGGLTC